MTDLVHPDRHLFDELAQWGEAPSTDGAPIVSLYIPIDPAQRHLDRLELRAAVSWAEHALVHDRGVRRSEAISMLSSLSSPEYAGTATGQTETRAMVWFATAGRSIGVGLPGSVGPSVTIGDVADTLGLVPFADAGPRYAVLVFSLAHVRLFAADRFSIREVPVHDMPRGMADALWYVQRESTMQRHGSGAVHASGDGREHRKEDIRRYAQLVLGHVRPLLDAASPVVVMGVGYETAIVAEELRDRRVTTLDVGSPDDLSAAVVHELSWPAVVQDSQAADDALALVAELLGTGRAVTSVADIDEFARQGAVQSILVARRLTDPPRTQGMLDGDRALLADAVTNAASAGATLLAVDDDRLPSGCTAAAVLRW